MVFLKTLIIFELIIVSINLVVVKLNGWSGTKTENLALVLMTSALPLGAMLASPFTVKVNSIFEGNLRRASIAVDSLAIIACIIQLVDYSLANLIIGRVIAGAIIGINCTLVPTYIAEISPIPLRGVTGCMNQLFICSGICISFIVGLVLPNK